MSTVRQSTTLSVHHIYSSFTTSDYDKLMLYCYCVMCLVLVRHFPNCTCVRPPNRRIPQLLISYWYLFTVLQNVLYQLIQNCLRRSHHDHAATSHQQPAARPSEEKRWKWPQCAALNSRPITIILLLIRNKSLFLDILSFVSRCVQVNIYRASIKLPQQTSAVIRLKRFVDECDNVGSAEQQESRSRWSSVIREARQRQVCYR